jgi:hypothetical protein
MSDQLKNSRSKNTLGHPAKGTQGTLWNIKTSVLHPVCLCAVMMKICALDLFTSATRVKKQTF